MNKSAWIKNMIMKPSQSTRPISEGLKGNMSGDLHLKMIAAFTLIDRKEAEVEIMINKRLRKTW